MPAAPTAGAGRCALLAGDRVAGHFGGSGCDLRRMRVMADVALLAACMRCHLDLRLRNRPSGHGLMAQGAKFHRVCGNLQLAVLRMAHGRAMTHLAHDALVAARGPLRAALGVAAMAITRGLVDRFLRGDFDNGVGAVVAEAVERVDREQRFGDRRDGKNGNNQGNQTNDVLGHGCLSGQRLRPSKK